MHMSVAELVAVARDKYHRMKDAEDALAQAGEMLDEARRIFGSHNRAYYSLVAFLKACLDDGDTPFVVRDQIRQLLSPTPEDQRIEIGGES